MIRYVRGDIFESKSQTLINTVNCRGVMGKGLALEFKSLFSGLYDAYANAVLMKELAIGRPTLWKGEAKWVINFPTKNDWRRPSEYAYIEAGLRALRTKLVEWEVTSLAIPPLGCGLGSLEWGKVKPMIELYLGDLPIDIEVFEP